MGGQLPLQVHGAFGNPRASAAVEIRRGLIHRQTTVVPSHRGIEQHRFVSLDQKPPLGQVPGAEMIEPLLTETDATHFPMAAEDGESIRRLQHPSAIIRARGRGRDVPAVVNANRMGHSAGSYSGCSSPAAG